MPKTFRSILTMLCLGLAGCSTVTTMLEPAVQVTEITNPLPDETHPAVSTQEVTTTAVEPSVPVVPEFPISGIQIRDIGAPENLGLFQEAGSYWTRYDGFQWDLIEPSRTEPPTYLWDQVDEAGLHRAVESGIEVIGVVLYAPEWAQKYPGIACGPIAEEALDAFADFMGELVSRYSQPPYNIKYWEVGNEPDVEHSIAPPRIGFGCWGEYSDLYHGGGYYAEMLKRVYPRIKEADPEAQVLTGGLLLDCDPVNPPEIEPGSEERKDCTPAKFLEGILQNDGGSYFDGVSFHAYDYYATTLGNYANGNWHSAWDTTGPVLIAKADYLRNLLESYGYFNKYLINSEVALLCGRDGKEDYCHTEDFNLSKAYYLAQTFAAARSEGLRANIWYSLKGWRGSQLVDEALQPNQAYQAFKFSANILRDYASLGEIPELPGFKGYQFTKDETLIWLIWASDTGDHPILLQQEATAIYDVFGNPLPVSQEISVTLAPIYIQWGP